MDKKARKEKYEDLRQRYPFFKSCYRKAKYKTQERADERVQDGLHSYFCIWCSYWHIGHIPAGYQKDLAELA